MKSPFKEGDVVVCINATGTRLLDEGQVYTIRSCFGSYYAYYASLKELGKSNDYDTNRFIIATELVKSLT